jgi:hypothetical protein
MNEIFQPGYWYSHINFQSSIYFCINLINCGVKKTTFSHLFTSIDKTNESRDGNHCPKYLTK